MSFQEYAYLSLLCDVLVSMSHYYVCYTHVLSFELKSPLATGK